MVEPPERPPPFSRPGRPALPPGRKEDTRRRTRRGGAGLLLTCTRVTETRGLTALRPNLAVELRDLGWGGIQFISTELLRPPCRLSVVIKDPATGNLVHARGSVVWGDTRPIAEGEMHVAGVKFDEVYTPSATCALFFQGPEPSSRSPRPEIGSDGDRPRRRHERYAVEDYFVRVTREAPSGAAANPVNLAFRLANISVTGAHVECTDQLDPGSKVRFILHLGRFADTFQSEAEVVWSRRGASRGFRAWNVGLQFKRVDFAAQKLLEYMISWLRSEKA